MQKHSYFYYTNSIPKWLFFLTPLVIPIDLLFVPRKFKLNRLEVTFSKVDDLNTHSKNYTPPPFPFVRRYQETLKSKEYKRNIKILEFQQRTTPSVPSISFKNPTPTQKDVPSKTNPTI